MIRPLQTLLFFLLISCSAIAQQYIPLLDATNHWTMVGNGLSVAPQHSSDPCAYPYFGTGYQAYDYITDADTLINGQTYKTVLVYDHNFTISCDFGYVREDTATKKVYFIDNLFSPEILLYDFSMNAGDSMFTTIVVPGSYFETGYYTVDSIYTLQPSAGNHRAFHLSKHSATWPHEMTWVEGVGCLENPFYPYSANYTGGAMFSCWTSQHMYIEYTSCFEHLNKVYYDSCAFASAMSNACFLVQDSCTYYDYCGGINELKNVKAFTLSPNPSRDETTINFEISTTDEYEFNIVSMTGQEVKAEIKGGVFSAGMNHVKFNTSGLTLGIYFVRCKNKYGQAFQKLIVM